MISQAVDEPFDIKMRRSAPPVTLPSAITPVVVTDLDGTLLDHHTYSWQAAEPALRLLQKLNIPLVLNSSKTAAEMRQIRKALGNEEPFVVENGGGICLPGTEESFITLGGDRAYILDTLRGLREQHGFRFRGIADMTTEVLMACTGLGQAQAQAAMDRQFTEPLLWQDDESRLDAFQESLGTHGLRLIRGGRFWHVSAPSDKGRAIQWLREYYSAPDRPPVHIIALGDGGNDVPMLETADTAVLIPSPVNSLPEVSNPDLFIPDACGPEGWNQALLTLLSGSQASKSNAPASNNVRNHG